MDPEQAEKPSPTIGKYRVIASLGKGGMANVYLAVSHGPSGFSKLVVLKMVRDHLLEDADTLQMFLDEARLAGRLSHPNVVQTLEVVEEGGTPMLVMEYLDGQPLASVLKRSSMQGKPFPLELGMRVVIDVLEGLQYAHDVKDFDGKPLALVHRDVSPQNIFLTYDGQVKVLDFGIAKAVTSSAETKAGVIKGKVAYMAPEQFVGEIVDRRADVYAVGVVIWQLLTGQRLWKGVPDVQVIGRVLRGEIPSPSTIKADIPAELERITMKALAFNRDERYPTALALQQDVEAFVDAQKWRASSRDIGGFVATLFADIREQVEKTIERQLKNVKALGSAMDSHPSLPGIGTISGVSSLVRVAGVGRGVSEDSFPGTNLEVSSENSRSGANSLGSDSGPMPQVEAVRQRERKRKIAWIGAATALAIAGIAAIALFVAPARKTSNVDTPAGSQTSSPTAVVPRPADTTAAVPSDTASSDSAPQQVQIKLEATPAAARIYFDDVLQPSNPVVKVVPRDATTHKVRVEAAGFEPENAMVSGEKDTLVSLELVRTGSPEAVAVRTGGRPRRAGESTASPIDATAPATTEPLPPPATGTPAASPPSTPDARDRIKALDKTNPWAD